MAAKTPKLEWCIVRLGQDMNWWVQEISDSVNWDVDGLGILDPRQIAHVIDISEPLREYGFDPSLIDEAFYSFRIDKELKPGQVRLVRARASLLESDEPLFALPNVMDEEKGPYADLLDRVTRQRVKLLNDLIDFSQNLTIEELEEEIRERQGADFLEGRSVHFFTELSSILEYVPEGYELEEDEAAPPVEADEGLEDVDLSDLDSEGDEDLEEDETMKWDEDDDGESEDGEDSEEGESDNSDEAEEEEDEEEKKPRRRSKGRKS